MKRFIAIWILLSAGLNIWQSIHKEQIGDLHTITIKNYGIFVVTQTSYESLRIGDEVRL